MDHNKLSVISRGLDDASDDLHRGNTVKLGFIKELARLLLRELGDDASSLFSVDAVTSNKTDAALTEVKKLIREGGSGALLSLYFAELFEKRRGKISFDELFSDEDSTSPSAAFVSGSGADSAFEIFNRHLGLSPIHAERISSACDAVLDGDAGYCILPLKNARDGRLRSFYRMIDTYDLKISAVCTAGTDENATRYALCGRFNKPLSPTPSEIEFSVPASGEEALLIAEAAKCMGHELSELSSSPSERDGEIYSFIFSSKDDYRPLILYMNIYHPRYTLTGLYNTINEY